MADCTKTAEFMREWERMCVTFDGCEKCPIRTEEIGNGLSCVETIQRHQTDAIAIVQKWSDEHPVMTWEDKLKELLPNAKEYAIKNIMHIFCPNDIFGAGGNGVCAADELCKDCWDKEAT